MTLKQKSRRVSLFAWYLRDVSTDLSRRQASCGGMSRRVVPLDVVVEDGKTTVVAVFLEMNKSSGDLIGLGLDSAQLRQLQLAWTRRY